MIDRSIHIRFDGDIGIAGHIFGDEGVVAFGELKKKYNPGAKISKEDFPIDYPAKLVFNNTKSIDVLINTLQELKNKMEESR